MARKVGYGKLGGVPVIFLDLCLEMARFPAFLRIVKGLKWTAVQLTIEISGPKNLSSSKTLNYIA